MNTLTTYTISGQKIDSLTAPASIFEMSCSPSLLAQAVRVYQTNQRQGTKKVKTRSEVSYSTKKIWKQKGTGNARHGSKKAPIFVGGGVAHGPKGNENYTLMFPKKMRRAALLGALTVKAENKQVIAITQAADFKGKSKDLNVSFSKVSKDFGTKKTLLILDQNYQNVLLAGRNLSGLTLTQAKRLNVYEILNNDLILIAPEAFAIIDPKLETKKVATKKSAPAKKTDTPKKLSNIKH